MSDWWNTDPDARLPIINPFPINQRDRAGRVPPDVRTIQWMNGSSLVGSQYGVRRNQGDDMEFWNIETGERLEPGSPEEQAARRLYEEQPEIDQPAQPERRDTLPGAQPMTDEQVGDRYSNRNPSMIASNVPGVEFSRSGSALITDPGATSMIADALGMRAPSGGFGRAAVERLDNETAERVYQQVFGRRVPEGQSAREALVETLRNMKRE